MSSTIIGGSLVTSGTTSGVKTPVNVYATIGDLRDYVSLPSGNTSDDTQLGDYLMYASRAIDRFCRRYFNPKYHSGTSVMKFDIPKRDLVFDHDILAVNGLSHLNGASEVDSSVYWLACGDTWNMTPYDRIVLDESSGSSFNYSGTPRRAIHVDVITGFHEDYPNSAWINSGASLTASMTAAQTSIFLSGSNGPDERGFSPRTKEYGQLLRVGNEIMYTAQGISTSEIRVVRGQNGTDAASHASAVNIQTWSPEVDIVFGTIRLAAMQYHQKQAPFTGTTRSVQFGIIESQDAWPPDVRERLMRYKRDTYWSIG